MRDIGLRSGDARQAGSRSLSAEGVMKKAVGVFLGLCVIGAATHALAVFKMTSTVVLGTGNFAGTPGDARASSDSMQYIGCVIAGRPSGVTGACSARNSAGVTRSCGFSSAGGFAQAVASISTFSNIAIWHDTGGNCTTVQVDNNSYNRPVTP